MPAAVVPPEGDQLIVRPWFDPVLDEVGHDPRSAYVERFWLSVLGPSATWFLRYVADQFDRQPAGFTLDMPACAAAIGLGSSSRRTGQLPRTLGRCCEFRIARLVQRHLVEVRPKLAPLSQRQLKRLPEPVRAEHARWLAAEAPDDAEDPVLADRARWMALSLLELGEGVGDAERQLERWRFPARLAREAIGWALDQRRPGAVAAPIAAGAR